MSKELVVSSSPHETRLAILEDDQLVEIYIERESQEGLAGSIHKGRVTRVLPGMQSAFVDIGLERDAFLYVSDFFEGVEEFEGFPPAPEGGPAESRETAPEAAGRSDSSESPGGQTREAAPERAGRRYRRGRRGRRRGQRERGFPEKKYASLEVTPAESNPRSDTSQAAEATPAAPEFAVLPGESLAKYRSGASQDPAETEGESPAVTTSRTEESANSADVTPPEDDNPTVTMTGVAEGSQSASVEVVEESLQTPSDEEPTQKSLSELPSGDPRPRAFVDDAETEESSTATDENDDPTSAEAADETRHSAASSSEDAVSGENSPERAAADQSGLGAPDSTSSSTSEEGEASGAAGGGEAERESGDTAASAAEQPAEGSPLEGHTDRVGTTPQQELAQEDKGTASLEGSPQESRGTRVRSRSGSPRYLQRRGRGGRRRSGRAREGADTAEHAASTQPEPQAETSQQLAGVASISHLLSKGREILVQIAKEPLGRKGARITSHIALPGRYLVYTPTVEHIGVSRKIASDAARHRLRSVVQAHRTGMPGGFIVRTAGDGAEEEDIRGDMLFLYNLWLDIREKAEKRTSPGLIHQDLDVVERVLRDRLGESFKTIWVDGEEEYERILRFVERFQPDLLPRVKLYTRPKPIFDEFNITAELEKALRPKVWLKSGGYIVINQTEALVAIDVNTGKYVGKSDRLEDTILNTNIEAAQEIVRQMRLRDLGGIIVADFIDMEDRKNRYKVVQALERELQHDYAPSKTLPFNDFGLVSITRKRVKQSLERTLCTPCPYCTGSGSVKSIQTVIYEILEEARKMAPSLEPGEKDVTLRVNPEVARTLKSRKNSYLQEIEEILKRHLLVRRDASLHREHFDIN